MYLSKVEYNLFIHFNYIYKKIRHSPIDLFFDCAFFEFLRFHVSSFDFFVVKSFFEVKNILYVTLFQHIHVFMGLYDPKKCFFHFANN